MIKTELQFISESKEWVGEEEQYDNTSDKKKKKSKTCTIL